MATSSRVVEDDFSESDSSEISSDYLYDHDDSDDYMRDPEFGLHPYQYEPEVSDNDDGSEQPGKPESNLDDMEHLARIGNKNW